MTAMLGWSWFPGMTTKSSPLVRIASTAVFILFMVSDIPLIVKAFFSPLIIFIPLSFIPLTLWLTLFANAKHIPTSIRPAIHTTILPAIDTFLFGENIVITRVSAHPTVFKDFLAALPYGILHYVSPVIVLAFLYRKSNIYSIFVYAKAFGSMNLLAVITQLVFPCAPPWHDPSLPATYSMPGSPAGLARIDQHLGTHMFTKTFNSNPLAWGAFPSLHAGWAFLNSGILILVTLFLFTSKSNTSKSTPAMIPRTYKDLESDEETSSTVSSPTVSSVSLRTVEMAITFFLSLLFVCLLCWSTMYLQHHYVVDLLAGFAYSMPALVYFSFSFKSLMASTHYHRLGDVDSDESSAGHW